MPSFPIIISFTVFSDLRKKISKIAGTKLDNAQKFIDEFEQKKKKVATELKKLQDVSKKIDAIHVEYMKLGDKAAKDLGIAPTKIPDFKKVNDMYFRVDAMINEMKTELNKYK